MSFVVHDPSTGGYAAPGHPEAPFRVVETAKRLRAAGHKIVPPSRAPTDADVLRVHAKGHLEKVRDGTFLDADTPHFPGIDKIALTSAAGALTAASHARAGEPSFSLMRPPGHHASGNRVAGFCYLNNVAMAAAMLAEGGRVAILDIDVHHGDGTEAIVRKRDNILFASLHQVPLYPGTGTKSSDNCLNFPLAEGTTEGPYVKTLETAIERILEFKPDVLAVSAGFDTYKEDPIAGLRLDVLSYRRIGKLIADTKLKRFAALEGGYAEAVPKLIERFLEGFFD